MGHNNHNKTPEDTNVLIEEFVRYFPFRVAFYRPSGRKNMYFPSHLSVTEKLCPYVKCNKIHTLYKIYTVFYVPLRMETA